jgi:hypothetical protein
MWEKYPQFALVHSTAWSALWHGELKPFAKSYSVQILYSLVALPIASIEAETPHVEVMDPVLRRRLGPHGAIPHNYPNRVMPERPRLCLYKGFEWSPSEVIADTIVPWTVEWLAAYEGWRATGVWSAGGHGTERIR